MFTAGRIRNGNLVIAMVPIEPIQGIYALRRHCLIGIEIPIINLRRWWDRHKFRMWIPIPVRLRLCNEWGRWRPLRWRHNGRDSVSGFFAQSFIQTQIKENIKVPRHWPMCAKFTGDRWIPRSNDQMFPFDDVIMLWLNRWHVLINNWRWAHDKTKRNSTVYILRRIHCTYIAHPVYISEAYWVCSIGFVYRTTLVLRYA